MNSFKVKNISLIIIGILFFVDCRKTDNITDTDPGQGAEQRREPIYDLKLDTYYLDIDSALVNSLRLDHDKTYYLPHKGEYKVIDIKSDYVLREAFSKLLVKLILESTDDQTACQIIKEYYLNRKLQLPGHSLYITKKNTYLRMRNRVDSIFGVKLLRYSDSINERFVMTPYEYSYMEDYSSGDFYCSSIANPRYILPKYNKGALDEYCKLPCDSLIRLLKEIVNTPSDYYYIPPIKD